MTVEKTKHEFVDDNPYLVYSGEPESTLDNAGGGGGGGGNDSPFLYVTVSEDLSTWEPSGTSLTISESKETIANAMRNNKIVMFVVNLTVATTSGNVVIQYFVRANAITQDNTTVFAMFYTSYPSNDFYGIIVDNNGANGQKKVQE